MRIMEGVNDYVEWGRSIRRSVQWQKLARYELEMFGRWMSRTHNIDQVQNVTERHVREYLIYLQKEHRPGEPLAYATVRHCFMNVKKYFEWLQVGGAVLHNPCVRIELPDYERQMPRVLSEGDMKRLIESPDIEKATGVRDRAMMELLYGTGIRHLECWKLTIYDVDVAGRQLMVRQGKGGKDRVAPMTKEASYWMNRYLGGARRELSKRPASPTSALWVSRDGHRLSYGRIEGLIKGYARKLEIEVTVHMFRHCYATHLLRNGADIRHIQKLLGHSDIQSTMIYTHLEINDLQNAVNKTG